MSENNTKSTNKPSVSEVDMSCLVLALQDMLDVTEAGPLGMEHMNDQRGRLAYYDKLRVVRDRAYKTLRENSKGSDADER